MPKSNSSDGRRGNRPPDEHKIRPGEVRNPYGRKGRAGGKQLSRIDEFYLKEAQRIVSRDESGDVNAAKRLVQEEYAAALVDKDSKARARVLSKLSQLQEKDDDYRREHAKWFFGLKFEMAERFRIAQERGQVPPQACHPDHIHLSDGQLVFTGPREVEFRKPWEEIKAHIKICSSVHKMCRLRVKQNPTEGNKSMLREVEASRRRLMRCVPKGWNWREEIYCRHSQTQHVKETIANLEDLR